MTTKTAEAFNLEALKSDLAVQHAGFIAAQPFPFTVFDDFLEEAKVNEVVAAFPTSTGDQWIHYLHYNEKKYGLNRMKSLPEAIQSVIKQLYSEGFLAYLTALTGIEGLIADDSLEGGGLHLSEKGGFLNIHADFTVHPHHSDWERRLNLILYLNEGWKPSYKGDLELWSVDMKKCEAKIAPIYNRCVVFATNADSYHGFPESLECPQGMSRKSIALYYYTKSDQNLKIRSTNYKSRPGDGIKALWIWADKQLVMIYTQVKKRLGLQDDFASKLLRFMSGKKK